MAPTLGKRKRQHEESNSNTRPVSGNASESENESVQDVFRRHFEAHFKPLLKVKKAAKTVGKLLTDGDREESEWGGLSESEDGERVEIIEYAAPESTSIMSKDEIKLFMSAKPPTNSALAGTSSALTPLTTKDEQDEVSNLKKDLALQRLLAESHLLDSSKNSSISGTNRHKATDLRLQTLGAKTSILKQEKMPMSHRKGIISKRSEREDVRRREARESGIILEKAKSGVKSQKEARRDRGIGGPGVGKFSGGTLKLSKKDIFDIEGPKRRSSMKSGRGGGRGGRTRRDNR